MTPDHGKLGGRPRKKPTDTQQPRRAATVIAEAARENADKIASVFIDVLLDPEAKQSDKLRAVKGLVGVEFRETDRERDEANDPSRAAVTAADVEDAKADLTRMLNDPITGPRLRAVLGGLVTQAEKPPKNG